MAVHSPVGLKLLRAHYTDTDELQQELAAHPHAWDTLPMRTQGTSPHRELSDIWLRYNALDNFDGDVAKFNAEHTPEWYPVIAELPAAKRLCERIAHDYHGDLGGVLITKIPAHKTCYPHVDQGWHARYYDKFALQVKGTPAQTFHVERHVLRTTSGDLFTFDNSKLHWVLNPTDEDRITMIVCLKVH